MRTLGRFFLWLVVLASLASPLCWPGSGGEPAVENREAVVRNLAEAIRKGYVLEKRGVEIADRLLAMLEQGAFKEAATKEDLAMALTRSLFELSGDRHLRVTPRGMDPASAMTGGGAGEGGCEGRPSGPHPMIPASPYSSRLLAGNVGLLEVGLLAPPLEEMESALRAIAGADALIIDVRRCPGGSMDAIRSLASALLDGRQHLVTHSIRGTGPMEVYTLEEGPGGIRFTGKPVFLLTSRFTGSGCEEIAFDLKYHEKAILVGESTGGAGHGLVGSMTDLGSGLEALVPNMRPVHPRFEGGFEGSGVPPDIPVPASAALGQAHLLALAQLARAEGDAEGRRKLESALQEASMSHAEEMQEGVIRERRLRSLAGAFEGGRRLVVADGGLRLENDSGMSVPLAEEGKDTYALVGTPGQKLRLDRDGSGTVVAISISAPGGGDWKRSARLASD